MKKRFILKRNTDYLGEFIGITDIARHLGCTRAHIYSQIDITKTISTFKVKKTQYLIIDKLG